MRFFKDSNYNFIGSRNKAVMFSGVLFLATIVSLIWHGGPNWSIDFVGGTLVQLKFEKPIVDDLAQIRSIVTNLEFGKPEIKTIGPVDANELQIIVKKKSQESLVGAEIKKALASQYGENPFELRREEQVGPKIGGELQQSAIMAVLLALAAIIVYMGFRFSLPFGIGAVIALFHDVVITLGVFSVLNVEVSLPIIAAFLTIVGYSLNDTIVVFDRVRENLGTTAAKLSFEDKVNLSINQTISRTIVTSLTTFLVVVIIYGAFFTSGDVIKDFSLALLVGVLVGTYSSIFIASPVLVFWNKRWAIK